MSRYYCLVVISALILCLAPRQAASEDAQISFQFLPDPPANEICSTDTVRALIWFEGGGTSVKAFTIFFTYVPGVAHVDSILPGTMLTAPGQNCFFLWEIGNGSVVDTLKIDAGVTGPAYGPGSLATIDFIGAAEGPCPLHFVDWDLCTEVGDICVSIPTEARDDTIFVSPATPVEALSLGELKSLFQRWEER